MGWLGVSVIQKTLNPLLSRIMNVPSVKRVLRCFLTDSKRRKQHLLHVKRLESLDRPGIPALILGN